MALGFQVTFDCSDPATLSRFWAAVLGYRPQDPPEGSATWEEWLQKMGVPEDEWAAGAHIVDPDGEGPSIDFQRVPEPKRVKNRVHLDLNVSARSAEPLDRRKPQIAAEVERVVGLGARRLRDHQEGDHYHVVVQDPEGNEFCMR